MNKKIFITAMAVVLCLMIGFTDTIGKCFAVPQYHYEVRTDLSIYFSNSDEVIATIRRCLKRHDWHITINYKSHGDNMDDIADLVKDLMYYAVAETDDPTEGDYICYQYGGYDLNYSHQREGEGFLYSIEIVPHYYTTPEQEEKVTAKVNEIVAGFNFNKNTTEYEKFRAVYDYVYSTVEYDDVHKNNEYHHLKTTAYSALFYGKAVCQGYSVLMYRLLREVGLNARVITGTAEYENREEFHAWNIVCLDGKYYNFDITWDKQTESEDYLLKCDENFDSHKRDLEFAETNFYQQYPMSESDYYI